MPTSKIFFADGAVYTAEALSAAQYSTPTAESASAAYRYGAVDGKKFEVGIRAGLSLCIMHVYLHVGSYYM